jgi:hypothetical protein
MDRRRACAALAGALALPACTPDESDVQAAHRSLLIGGAAEMLHGQPVPAVAAASPLRHA